MASTVFTDYTTPIVASWLNDVNAVTYSTGAAPGSVLVSNGDSVLPTWSTLANAYAGWRNRVINGDFRVDQRYAGAVVTPAVATQYIADRFRYSNTQVSKLSFQQVTDAPAGFKFSEKISVAASYTPLAADQFILFQPIEGTNLIDVGFGTATPSTISISLWCKSSVPGTYAICLVNAALNRSYVGTITVTSSWARQAISLAVDGTGTWATDTSVGCYLGLDLGSGSNFNAAVGAWQAGNFTRNIGTTSLVAQSNGTTFNITGVQFENSATVNPFEQLSTSTILGLCQRYFFKTFPQGTAPAQNAGLAGALCYRSLIAAQNTTVRERIPLQRIAPTVTTFNPSAANALWRDTTNSADRAVTLGTHSDNSVTIQHAGGAMAAAADNFIHYTADSEF